MYSMNVLKKSVLFGFVFSSFQLFASDQALEGQINKNYFKVTRSYTFDDTSSDRLPFTLDGLAAGALRKAQEICDDLDVELVSSYHLSRPTKNGAVTTYIGTYRCPGY